MPKYKITYFNLKARGELSRLVLIAAGVEFEDNRVDYDENIDGSEQWTELKPGNIKSFHLYLSKNIENACTLYLERSELNC